MMKIKRILALMLAFIFVIFAFSCDTSKTDETAATTDEAPVTTEDKGVFVLTDPTNETYSTEAKLIVNTLNNYVDSEPQIIAYSDYKDGDFVVLGASDQSGTQDESLKSINYHITKTYGGVVINCDEETAEIATDTFIERLNSANGDLTKVDDCDGTIYETLVDDLTLKDESTVTVAEGVVRSDLKYENKNGEKVNVYKTVISPGSAKVTIGTANASDEPIGKQSVLEQAELYDANGSNVLVAINADFFGEGGEPCGLLIKNGVRLHKMRGGCFFGILKDGTLICGNDDVYKKYKDEDFENAVGAGHYIVADGKFNPTETVKTMRKRDPRSCIGYTADGTCIIVAIDGRQPGMSGVSMYDLANLMIDYGCIEAVNLDGGGSTQLIEKNPETSALEVVNSPCELPYRKVFDTIMITK